MDATIEADAGRVVRGGMPYTSAQGTVYEPGIATETVGSASLFLGIVTLAPGQRTRAHVHARHASAFYLLSGPAVELWTGALLQHRMVAQAGDFLYIPAGVPHVAVNRGTEPAVFVGARTEGTAQESVVMRPELDARVP